MISDTKSLLYITLSVLDSLMILLGKPTDDEKRNRANAAVGYARLVIQGVLKEIEDIK